ncbi:hypothetical protein TTHERM_00424610 (macronuclear) [Tetrahymena thermophila SB210]|uniref:Centrosomal protein of 19 kDa n=1 Tax=Tetrahymena thermophila (strain SB210) TaxID=312017 RepID=Q23AJ9_TETTS|nr:hypothetical protein TTHERM_00424610 [Tetrahymena thermophila SB210]EAR93493.1 hypothetical protein TTHERM_00424610 [Tetrahymena thermophila SB210]|eukprot:XP_001013738.1 hypothetical protein TTHERM_00424610 [Tetrahymena thermophila SB210]
MYNFSIGGNKNDPYNFSIGGSSSSEPKKGFGLTGSLSKNGGLTGGLSSVLTTSQTKKASSSYTSGFGGGFGETKSIQEASKSTQAASSKSTTSKQTAAAAANTTTTTKQPKTQASKKGAKTKFGKEIIPKRFGLLYDPPTITLEYLDPNSGNLYHHKMKLKKLQQDTDVKDAIEYLRIKHETYLNDDSITDDQLKSLVQRLQKRMSSGNKSSAKTAKPSQAKVEKPKEPPKKSNSLAPLTGNDFKGASSGIRGASTSSTTASSLLTGSSQIRSQSASNSKTAAASSSIYGSKPSYLRGGNDDDDDEDDYENEEEVFKYAWSKKGAGSIQTSKMSQQQDEYDYYKDDEDEEDQEDQEEDEDEDDYKIDYNNYNLNKLSNEELQKHKDRMEVLFKKNNLKPGDKGFQYNIEQDFNPDESNEWDEDI